MNKAVAILKIEEYETSMVENAIEQLFAYMPVTEKITEYTKILLKPNLLAKHPPEHAVTTHPEVVRGVIRACVRRGAKVENIILADSAGGVYNPRQMKALYHGCQLTEVCQQAGIEMYTACETSILRTPNGKVVKEFEILTPILDADFIINLPKFKSHVMTGMTAACKNMFGAIPGLKKSEWHMRFPDKERFGDMLIDLLENLKPDLAILDGILAMEGDGPAGGEPRQLGILMASEDMVNLDLAVAHMMGLDPMRVPYLNAAHLRGLGNDKIDFEDIIGDKEAFRVVEDFKLSESYQGTNNGYIDFAEHLPKFVRPLIRNVEEAIAPRPVINKKLCIGCGKCAEICSQDTIVIQNKKGTILRKNCIRCFCCHEMCPVKAIDVKKMKIFGL